MPSLIKGYNYDIFISYRQKDNKGDRWVSKFVDALKTELETTFKEEVSVYFDESLHDRLQENHSVKKSLESKLKCLIFIPIISRTYCDPESYAWQNEFQAFIMMADEDSFGRDIKLKGGNVASRVLPVRIHDIEQEDIGLFEKETCGFMRAIDFIFRTGAGVNRPLDANEQHPYDNLNKTYYKDQINKVALAVREIIQSMKNPVEATKEKPTTGKEETKLVDQRSDQENKQPLLSTTKKLFLVFSVLVVIIFAGILLYPKIFQRDSLKRLKSSDGKLSVAVMPFRNRTNDSIWNVWQDGVKDNVITYLSNFSEDLTVKQPEAVNGVIQGRGLTNYASITPSIAGSISRDLDANIYVSGSISQAGSIIRINSQLVNAKTEESFKSFQLEGDSENEVFQMIDSLSIMIKDFLLMSVMEKEAVTDFQPLISTNSPEAYRYYIYGTQAFYVFDYQTANDWFIEAVEIDTNFTEAMRLLAYSYGHLGMIDKAKEWTLRLHNKRDNMSMLERLYADAIYSGYFETIYEEIKNWSAIIEFDDQMPVPYSNLAGGYEGLNQYDEAISLREKELEIYDNWGVKPRWVASYTGLGRLYHLTGQYKKERKIYDKAGKDFPDDSSLLYWQAILALSENKMDEADNYIEKFISRLKIYSVSEANISENLAYIYKEANMPDQAEEYFRTVFSIKPDDPGYINNLASFMIDNDRNVEEAMQLIDKAIEINPDNFVYYWTKGEGLYKQGKYTEALETLEKSWDLLPIAYNHGLYVLIEEVKEVILN